MATKTKDPNASAPSAVNPADGIDEVRVGLATGSRAVLGGTNDDAVETTIVPIVDDAEVTSPNASVLVTAEGKKGPAASAVKADK